jgi:hypothetical protein
MTAVAFVHGYAEQTAFPNPPHGLPSNDKPDATEQSHRGENLRLIDYMCAISHQSGKTLNFRIICNEMIASPMRQHGLVQPVAKTACHEKAAANHQQRQRPWLRDRSAV